jgi:hypothetical protein
MKIYEVFTYKVPINRGIKVFWTLFTISVQTTHYILENETGERETLLWWPH